MVKAQPKKKQVLIITGTRADYGLLRPVISELLKSKKLTARLLVTGMHFLKSRGYTLSEVLKDEFPIAARVPVSEQDDMLQCLVKEIAGIRAYCLKHRPAGIFVLGDRDEMLAAAVVGAHLGIPVLHLRGGELTGYVVDENIRHAITKFSSLHFVTTKNHRRRVLQLGEEPWRVFVTGVTEFDDLSTVDFPSKAELGRHFGLNPDKNWFVVLQHPTPLDVVPLPDQIQPLLKVLAAMRNVEKLVIYPNADTGGRILIREIEKYRGRKDFHITPNLPRRDYLGFLKRADLLIGNSSSGIVESGFFKIPVVQVGTREQGRERGKNVIECGYDESSIRRAITRATSSAFRALCQRAVSLHGRSGVSKKIVRLIEKHIYRQDLLLKRFHIFPSRGLRRQ